MERDEVRKEFEEILNRLDQEKEEHAEEENNNNGLFFPDFRNFLK